MNNEKKTLFDIKMYFFEYQTLNITYNYFTSFYLGIVKEVMPYNCKDFSEKN